MGCNVCHRRWQFWWHPEAGSPGQQPRGPMVGRAWPRSTGKWYVARRLCGADIRRDMARAGCNRDCDVCRMGGRGFGERTRKGGGSSRWAVDRASKEMISIAMVRRQMLFRTLPVAENLRLLRKYLASDRLPGSGSPLIR